MVDLGLWWYGGNAGALVDTLLARIGTDRVRKALATPRGELARWMFDELAGSGDPIESALLAARKAGADDLADVILESGLPLRYRTCWAHARVRPPGILSAEAHNGGITGIRVDRAVGSTDDRTVIVSVARTGQILRCDGVTGTAVGEPIIGYRGDVRALTTGRLDGRRVIVAGADDRTVRVWDLLTGAPVCGPFTADSDVWAVAVSAGGLVLTGGRGPAVQVWDPATGSHHRIRCDSPVYRSMAVAGDILVTVDADRALLFWDLATRSLLRDPVRADCRALAVGPDGLVTGGYDGVLRLWNPTTGERIGTPMTGHRNRVEGIATGSGLVVSYSDGALWVHDTATGAALGRPRYASWEDRDAIGVMRIDGRAVVVRASTARVWMIDVAAAEVTAGAAEVGGETMAVGPVGSGMAVVCGLHRDVEARDATTGDRLWGPASGHLDLVEALAIGQVGGRPVVVSGCRDRTVRMWDANSGDCIGRPLGGHRADVDAVTVGPVGDRTIVVSSSGLTFRMWDAATRKRYGDPIKAHPARCLVLADGRLYSAGADGAIRVWDPVTRSELIDPMLGHTGGVLALAVGELNGRSVVVSGGGDATIRIWDARTGAPVCGPIKHHERWVWSVAIGRVDGESVVVSGGYDPAIQVWRLTDGGLAKVDAPIIVGGNVRGLRVAFDGPDELIVGISGQGLVRVCLAGLVDTAEPIGK